MLSTSLFYLDFHHITWTSYKTRTNLLVFKFQFFLILYYFPQQFLYFLPDPQGPLYSGFLELLGALGTLIQLSVALGSTP